MIHNFPYTNLHDLNIDWILQIIKDFKERYQNLDETFQNMLQQITAAGNNAIEAINNNKETALEAIRVFEEQCIQALDNETSGNITEIQNVANNQLNAISSAGTAQVNIINGLITSLPQTYEDSVNQLQIINAVLNQTYNYPPLVQGHYADSGESDSKTLVADNYRVSTLLSAGCASKKIKIQITGSSGIIREIIYWTGWGAQAIAHGVPVSTSTSEKTVYEYTFPATATYFTIVFCSDYNMLTEFLVSDLQVSFEWKFTALESIELHEHGFDVNNTNALEFVIPGNTNLTIEEGSEISEIDVSGGSKTVATSHKIKDDVARSSVQQVVNIIDGASAVSIELDQSDFEGLEQHSGNISNNGSWNNITDSYKHVYVPITRPGGTLVVTANSSTASKIAFVSYYRNPVDGSYPAYCTDSDYNTYKTVSSGDTSTFQSLPYDCSGVIVMTKYTSSNPTPTSFVYNAQSVEGLVSKVNTNSTNISELTNDVVLLQGKESPYNRYNLSGLVETNGNLSSTQSSGVYKWNNINANYKHVVIPVTKGMVLNAKANSELSLTYAALTEYTPPTSTSDIIHYSTATGWTSPKQKAVNSVVNEYLPSDCKFLAVMVLKNGNNSTPVTISVTLPSALKIKWLAMGDSITEGFYSVTGQGEDTEALKSKDSCYVNVCALYKNFNVDNQGVGGSGWLKRGTELAPKKNAREQIDEHVDPNDPNSDYVIDFTKYDVVTAMFGVNDWKGQMNFGSIEDGPNPATESVIGNMMYFIETAQQRNPKIKIILITPVNCRIGPGSSAANNWGIGFAFGGKTLQDYYDAIKSVCEYYDIQYIDMLHDSIINRLNAETMLPDKVHPSLDAHKQMGIGLAGKFLYG